MNVATPQKKNSSNWFDRGFIALPILWTMGLVDPFLGELRR